MQSRDNMSRSSQVHSSWMHFSAMLSSHRAIVLALCLFNGWVFAMSWSGVFNDAAQGSAHKLSAVSAFLEASGHSFWIVSLVVCTATLGILFCVRSLHSRVRSSFVVTATVLLSLSALFMGIAQFNQSICLVLSVVASVFSGVGTGILTVYLGMLLMRYDSSIVLQFMAFSLIGSAFITLAVSLLPSFMGIAAMIIIPLGCMAAFFHVDDSNKESVFEAVRTDASDGENSHTSPTFYRLHLGEKVERLQPESEELPSGSVKKKHVASFVLFMGIVLILGLSAGLLRDLTSIDTFPRQSTWVFVIATLCASAMLLLSKVPGDGESFRVFYRVIVLIALAFILLALVAPQMGRPALWVFALHTVGFVYFYGLLWVFLVIYMNQYADSARVFIGGFLANQLGQILGVVVVSLLQTEFGFQASISPIANAMIYLLFFATIILLAKLSTTPSETPAKPKETMNSETAMKRACALAAERYNLTPREAEILDYLVKGYNRGYIAESLVVSPETVKTHTQHVYTKLNAHSRLEVFNAVARCLDEEQEKLAK